MVDPRTAPGNSSQIPLTQTPVGELRIESDKYLLPENKIKTKAEVSVAYDAWRAESARWGAYLKEANKEGKEFDRRALFKAYDALHAALDPFIAPKVPPGKYWQFEPHKDVRNKKVSGIQWFITNLPKKGLGLREIDLF